MNRTLTPKHEIGTLFAPLLSAEDVFKYSQEAGMTGGFRSNPLRAIYWKVFTGCLSRSGIGQWQIETQVLRQQYAALRLKFVINPEAGTEDADLALNNPLSTAKESKWAQYFEDNQLCKQIQLDLSRTYPTVEFFQSPAIQTAMLNILFIWSKLHPDYSYRQGMNELLAPIMLVVCREARSPPSADLVWILLNEEFTEHDSYHIFDRVMCVMAPYYAKSERIVVSAEDKKKIADTTFMGDKMQDEETPLSKKCHQIHHQLLPQTDPVLYEHLQSVGVQPQLYLIRWVRLLFAQEFHLEDVVVLWDALLGRASLPLKPNSFPLLDCVAIAMLLYVRQTLLEGDNSLCLRRLLKYPPVEEISVIVEKALSLLAPKTGPLTAKGFLFKGAPASSASHTPSHALSHSNHTTTTLSSNNNSSSHSIESEDDNPLFDTHHAADVLRGGAKKFGKFLKHNIHVPGHETRQQPNLFSSSGSDDRKEATEVKKQVEDMRKLMQEMGQLLNTVVVRMHSEYTTSSAVKAQFSESVLLESIAELKHCKDVLLGRLSINDYLQFLADNPTPSTTITATSPDTQDVDPLAIIVKSASTEVSPSSSSPTTSTLPSPSVSSSFIRPRAVSPSPRAVSPSPRAVSPSPHAVSPSPRAFPASSTRTVSPSPRAAAPTVPAIHTPLSKPLSDAARMMLEESTEPESFLFSASPRGRKKEDDDDDEDDFTSRLKSDSVIANPLLADLLG